MSAQYEIRVVRTIATTAASCLVSAAAKSRRLQIDAISPRSNPALASIEVGERLYKAALEDLAKDFKAFEAGGD